MPELGVDTIGHWPCYGGGLCRTLATERARRSFVSELTTVTTKGISSEHTTKVPQLSELETITVLEDRVKDNDRRCSRGISPPRLDGDVDSWS